MYTCHTDRPYIMPDKTTVCVGCHRDFITQWSKEYIESLGV